MSAQAIATALLLPPLLCVLVVLLGGLCVVLTEFHESPRIDRQLVGRCARQGDPGTCIAIVALDDEQLDQLGDLLETLNRPPADG